MSEHQHDPDLSAYHGERTRRPTSAINTSANERLWSVAGGAVLTGFGLIRRGWLGLGASLLGLDLIYRGATGFSLLYRLLGTNRALVSKTAAASVPHGHGLRVEEGITVSRPIEEVYEFWRDFANLPRFMENVESVVVQDGTRSHWVVKGPAGVTVEWDAEIVNDVPNARIAWRTVESSKVNHAGTVHFTPAPGARGTEIHVELEYAPIAGAVGAAVANLFRRAPKQQISDDLRRLKSWLEAGEILTTEGQPSGRARA